MEIFWTISAGILGTIVGSFLNVVILRMGTGRGIGGRSACFSCNKTLCWYELVPIVSFLIQRGRCRNCGSKISWQYPMVEFITGILFASVTFQFFGTWVGLGIWIVIVSLGMIIAVYDLRHKMVPLYPLIGIFILGLLWHASVVGFLGVPLLFLILWAVSRGAWIGFGDIEIMAVAGFLLGITGGFSAVLLGFWIAAGAVVLWIILGKKSYKKIRHLQIPMGPFLLLGMYLVGVWGIDIVRWFLVMLY